MTYICNHHTSNYTKMYDVIVTFRYLQLCLFLTSPRPCLATDPSVTVNDLHRRRIVCSVRSALRQSRPLVLYQRSSTRRSTNPTMAKVWLMILSDSHWRCLVTLSQRPSRRPNIHDHSLHADLEPKTHHQTPMTCTYGFSHKSF